MKTYILLTEVGSVFRDNLVPEIRYGYSTLYSDRQ